MNLAFVIDSLAVGGAQKHVRQIVCALAAEGHSIDVYVLNPILEVVYVQPMRLAGVRVHAVGRASVLSGIGMLTTAWSLWTKRTQVVVTVLFVSTVFGRIAAQLAGCAATVSCIQARNIDFRAWQRALLKMTAPLSSIFVTNARSVREFACIHEGAVRRRVCFIPNAVEPCGTIDPGLRGRRDLLPFENGTWVIGCVARLETQKNVETLLRAFAHLGEQYASARLVLVGDGSLRKRLEAMAEQWTLGSRVFFAGVRDDVGDLLTCFDVFVLPSSFEGTPNALMEAMVAGVPVIATEVDGTTEVVRHGRNGYLFPAGDVAALTKALVAALTRPNDFWQRAAVASAEMRLLYGVEALGRRYQAVINSFRADHPVI